MASNMTDITGNVWAAELNDDGNVWSDNTVDPTSNNGSQGEQIRLNTNNTSDRNNERKEEITMNNSIELSYQVPVTLSSTPDRNAPVDEELIWRDVPTDENEAETILDDDNIWKDTIENRKNADSERKKEKEEIENATKQLTQLDSGIQKSIVPAGEEPEEESQDNFDDFGDFEEIPTKSLNFGKPLEELLAAIFSGIDELEMDNQNAKQREKSTLLVNGGTRPMKCYNTIIASDRQHFTDTIPILNTRQRGCIETMHLHHDVLGIVNKWIYDEKGINTDSEMNISLSSNKQSWRNIGRHGIFRWSSKVGTDDESDRETDSAEYNLTERNIIGQRLLNVSFEQARRIIEARSEEQKKTRLAIEKAKWEREQILKKEQLKKEEEMAKYTVESVDVKSDKKKGFFGKMFASKSKIAKDHISHKKIVQPDDNDSDFGDISLKEQMEREGYNLSSGKNKKRKLKRRGRSKDADNYGGEEDDYDDDDDDGGDDDDNDDGFGEMVGYNVLDPNVDVEASELPIIDNSAFENTIALKTDISSEKRNNIQRENQTEDVNMTTNSSNESFGENIYNNNGNDHDHNSNDDDNSDNSDNNDNNGDDCLTNFQIPDVSSTQKFSGKTLTQGNQCVGNLIDL